MAFLVKGVILSGMPMRGRAHGYGAAARRVLPRALVTLALGVIGCQPAGTRPLRSPSRDYPAPPPQTSDGLVVGADNRDPADTLATGVTTDGLAPGWSLRDGKPVYDPNARVAGQTEHGTASETHHDHNDDSSTDAQEHSAARSNSAAPSNSAGSPSGGAPKDTTAPAKP